MSKKKLLVAIPVYNEEKDLPKNIPLLNSYLASSLDDLDWEIVIVDNASTDQTPEIGRKLAAESGVSYVRLPEKGRGGALSYVWERSGADYLSYMDVDLSSDFEYFPKLIEQLKTGADVAIGSRLAKGATVYGRPFLREIMSRGYSFLFRVLFATSFLDAQCGFKAIKNSVAKKVLPLVSDREWFFDSELLIICDKAGYKIAEVPITWRDDPASTVKVAKTAWGDIKGLVRLFMTRPWERVKIKD